MIWELTTIVSELVGSNLWHTFHSETRIDTSCFHQILKGVNILQIQGHNQDLFFFSLYHRLQAPQEDREGAGEEGGGEERSHGRRWRSAQPVQQTPSWWVTCTWLICLWHTHSRTHFRTSCARMGISNMGADFYDVWVFKLYTSLDIKGISTSPETQNIMFLPESS